MKGAEVQFRKMRRALGGSAVPGRSGVNALDTTELKLVKRQISCYVRLITILKCYLS